MEILGRHFRRSLCKKAMCFQLFFLTFTVTQLATAQHRPVSSLLEQEYQFLKERFGKYYLAADTINAHVYADALIAKAITEKDTVKIADGLYMKKTLEKDSQKQLVLLDSMISLTRKLKNEKFPCVAFFDKGRFFYRKQQFRKALEHYIQAMNHNNGNGQDVMQYMINSGISKIKTQVGDHTAALHMLKTNWRFVNQKDYRSFSPEHYLDAMYYLSQSFRQNSILDSAGYYNKLGLQESNELNNDKYHKYFQLENGILSFYNKDPEQATQKITAYTEQLHQQDLPHLAMGYYYLGEAQLELKLWDAANFNFRKIDSLFGITYDLPPEITKGYRYIIDYYKKKEDIGKQLYYLNRLITVDSIIKGDFKSLSHTLNDKYDRALLEAEKKAVINSLEKKNQQSSLLLKISMLCSFLILVFSFWLFWRNRQFKKRFGLLMDQNTVAKETTSLTIRKEASSSEIAQEVIERVEKGLMDFESSEQFLNSGISLAHLASKLKTNTTYLSRIIKDRQGANFASYLKDLRVKYAFNRLKNDRVFRNYSVKSIALESGFKGAESFSKTFHAKYGLYPSYFIKKLKATLD